MTDIETKSNFVGDDAKSGSIIYDENEKPNVLYYHDKASLDSESQKGWYFASGKGKRIVYFMITIVRISDVDTAKETFNCRFRLQLAWLATFNEYQKYIECCEKNATLSFKPIWNAFDHLEFINEIDGNLDFDCEKMIFKMRCGEPPSDEKYDTYGSGFHKDKWGLTENEIGFVPWRGYFIESKYETVAVFAEEFELNSFPFDVRFSLTLGNCDT